MLAPAVCTALLLAPAVVFAQRAPAADDIPKITINKVSTSGSGCPGDSVAVTISSDRTIVTLGFKEFQLGIGDGYTVADNQKECLVHLNLHYPAGYSYAVVETTYHGYAQLDAGVEGEFETVYTFADENGEGLLGTVGDLVGGLVGGLLGPIGNVLFTATSSLISGGGPFEVGDTFTVTEVVPARERVEAPCEGKNADLLVKTTIGLTTRDQGAGGLLSEDDTTISLTQEFHVSWEKC